MSYHVSHIHKKLQVQPTKQRYTNIWSKIRISPNNVGTAVKGVGTAVKDAIFLLKCSLSDLRGTLSAIDNLILQKTLDFN